MLSLFSSLQTAGNLNLIAVSSFSSCCHVYAPNVNQRHLSPYILCSLIESLSRQSSFRPAQSGCLVLVAHGREQLLFLPAAGRPTTSRPLPELVPLVSGPTNTQLLPPLVQLHNAAGVYQASSLPVKLNCNPSELHFTLGSFGVSQNTGIE